MSVGLTAYWKLKLSFFQKHSYRGGDYAPIIPATIIVKRDERGVPTECHIRPYRVVLPQSDCIVLLSLLQEVHAVPLLVARYSRELEKLLYHGVPSSLQQGIMLLEDVPAEPIEAVINNIYDPPGEELDEHANLILATTATATALDSKIPTVLLIVGGLSETWIKMRRLAAEDATNSRAWPPRMSKLRSSHELKRVKRRVEKIIAEISGQTTSVLLVNQDPPLAFYPLFI